MHFWIIGESGQFFGTGAETIGVCAVEKIQLGQDHAIISYLD